LWWRLPQSLKPWLADGHEKDRPSDAEVPGQHTSPAHIMLEPGHCTLSPSLQKLRGVVVVDEDGEEVLLMLPRSIGAGAGVGAVALASGASSAEAATARKSCCIAPAIVRERMV